MRHPIRCVVAAQLIVAALSSRAAAQPIPAARHTANRRELRQQEFIREHLDEAGRLRPDLLRKGVAAASRMSVVRSLSARVPTAPVLGGQWRQIGPAPLRIEPGVLFQGAGPDSGEVVDIAIDPRGASDQTIYIATNDGGVWKSTDGGSSWTPKTDDESKFTFDTDAGPALTLSMGAIALDPDNPDVVYAGTGNLFDGGHVFSKGVGLYKSTNGGDTWTVLNPDGIFTRDPSPNDPDPAFPCAPNPSDPVSPRCGGIISKIVVMKSESGMVLLVGTDRGLWRSVDGGSHFGSNPPADDDFPVLDGFIADLDVDTATATTVYAAVRGKGIFRSTDGGLTFPANLFNNTGKICTTTPKACADDSGCPVGELCISGPPQTPYDNIAFVQSTLPNARVMYANVAMTGTPPTARLYRSRDLGAHWDRRLEGTEPAEAKNCTQCSYDLTLGMDPRDPDSIYFGYTQLYSTDGSTVGIKIDDHNVHFDQHALVFSPRTHWNTNPTRFYVGTDGGIATTIDGGNTWSHINTAIATNLFKNIDIGRNSVANNAWTYGGTQDTGTDERRADCRFSGLEWGEGVDSDGGGVGVDPQDPTSAYGASGGNFVFTRDGGKTWAQRGRCSTTTSRTCREDNTGGNAFGDCPGGENCVEFLIWRYAIDPNNGKNVFAVGATNDGFRPATVLYRSGDRGDTFAYSKTFPAAVQSIANVKSDSNVVWVGLRDGTVQRTLDALAATPRWDSFTVTAAPANQPVTGIAIDPGNTNQVVAIYPGFTGKHVFRTTNDGVDWSNITGNLPDLPLHSVVIDPATTPHTIIVASDNKVFASSDVGATWAILGTGMPPVDAESLALDASCPPTLLRVGTYGRSVFELGGGPDRVCPSQRHYQCYEMPVGPFPTTSVTLKDRFGASTVDVVRRKRLCNPADKNGEDPTAPFDPEHLTGYVIKQTTPAFTPITGVTVTNQFGTVVVDLVRPEYLLVPAAKGLDEAPGPLGGLRCRGGSTNDGAACTDNSECPGGACRALELHCRGGANDGAVCRENSECPGGACGIDHFKCYRVRNAKTQVPGVKLTDQLGTLTFDIKRPVRLCVAADKNGEAPGAENHPAELMCYKGRQSSLPRFRGVDPIFIHDQFGPAETQIDHLREFCVPPLAPTPTPALTCTPAPSPTQTPIPTSTARTPTPTPTPTTKCCEVPFEGLGGNDSTVCLDAVSPDVETKCDAASGMIMDGVCDPASEGCITSGAMPGDLCCECQLASPPFPHHVGDPAGSSRACFPLAATNRTYCNTTDKRCVTGANAGLPCTTDNTDTTTGCPGNAQCTGAGMPLPCCTGIGTGTCGTSTCPGCCVPCTLYEGVPCGSVSEACGGP